MRPSGTAHVVEAVAHVGDVADTAMSIG
jgi:hypothetical protein